MTRSAAFSKFLVSLRQRAWAWPFLVALGFAAGVALWLQWTDHREREEQHAKLIADALTVQSRTVDWLAAEQAVIDRLAAELPAAVDNATLLQEPSVTEGLQRLWISVTVLDADLRMRAHVPSAPTRRSSEESIESNSAAARSLVDGGGERVGLTAHLTAPHATDGRVIVRFAPSAVLRQAAPWWLTQRYEMRLIDHFGQLIASTGALVPMPNALSYRVALEPALEDAYLELTVLQPLTPWWREVPIALLIGFLLLSAAATASLRRRMIETTNAETRWRTEAAWRHSIEDSLTVGLRGRDLEGRLVHVNRAFCDLVGYKPEELIGRGPPMPYWPPDETEHGMRRHLRNMAGGAPRDGYEARWQTRDGKAIDVIVFEAPLVDRDGQHIGWMGSIVDVTARRQAEERERRQREMLATRSRLAAFGEIASALAHQLNQPLAAIAGYNAGVLRSLETVDGVNSTTLEALRRLGTQATEAGRIVQRIRDVLTRRSPQRSGCELPPIIEGALNLLKQELRRARVDFALQIATALPPVQVDAVLIEQVLINLVRNALDEFALQNNAHPQLTITVNRSGQKFLRVDVDDNGGGLGGRSIDTLAAAFHSTKASGMGMGLAICRSIVEAHQGGMDAAISPLGGARLSFTLPVDQETP